MENYIVVRGDTLSAIARRAHISLKALIAANRQIKNPDKILVGQIVNLPIDARHPEGAVGGPTLVDVSETGLCPAVVNLQETLASFRTQSSRSESPYGAESLRCTERLRTVVLATRSC